MHFVDSSLTFQLILVELAQHPESYNILVQNINFGNHRAECLPASCLLPAASWAAAICWKPAYAMCCCL